jgi:hypothetical protein
MRISFVLIMLFVASPALSQAIMIQPPGVSGFPTERGYSPEYSPRHHRPNCRALRNACAHKVERGEEGMGNCQRYREMCE